MPHYIPMHCKVIMEMLLPACRRHARLVARGNGSWSLHPGGVLALPPGEMLEKKGLCGMPFMVMAFFLF
jgi:hypothetical protein